MSSKKLENLVSLLQRESKPASNRRIIVGDNIKKVLNYFIDNNVCEFEASGFYQGSPGSSDHYPPYVSQISKKIGLPPYIVHRIVLRLEKLGIVGKEKGMSSVSGAEYYFGLRDWVAEQI